MANIQDIKTDIRDLIEVIDDTTLLEFVHQILHTQKTTSSKPIDILPEHEKKELYESFEDSFKHSEVNDFKPNKYKGSKGI